MTMRSYEVAPALRRRYRRAGTLRRSLAFAGLLVFGTAPLAAQRPVDLHTFRFWRPGDLTLVEAYATVPLPLLTFSTTGETRSAIAAGILEVRDSSGLALLRETWVDTVRVPALTTAALLRSETAQHFSFQVKPGRYSIRVQITDAATQRSWTAEKPIEAFATQPTQSDLVVASDLLILDPDSPRDPNAMVRGRLGVLPNFSGALTTGTAKIALYTEVYRPGMPAESALAVVQVTGKSRDFRYQTPAQPRIYPTGIASEAFALDLTGLPEGSYDLALRIVMRSDTLESTHPLEMLPPGAGELQLAQVTVFDPLAAEQLDSLFAPMRYIATPSEQASYQGLTSAEAKRRFMTQFWQTRAAGAGESLGSVVQDWLERLQFVNRDFRPTIASQGGRQGWQTDRGRIYLKYGPPVERAVAYQTRIQEIKGCELWQYTAARGDRFVFFDVTGFGDFDLVYSTDRTEQGVPGYESLFRDGTFTCS